jgi:hypothetical protein
MISSLRSACRCGGQAAQHDSFVTSRLKDWAARRSDGVHAPDPAGSRLDDQLDHAAGVPVHDRARHERAAAAAQAP